jgi:anaerobic selenocysteine-containing dehydrogenase
VDPRRSETAALADEHLPIEPGRDPLLLAALIRTMLEEELGRPSHLDDLVDGRAALADALAPFRPESVEADLGMPAERLRALARAFAAAPSAACYARLGTCVSSFGTLTSWLVDVLGLVTGNLDRAGGAMFASPAVDLARIADWRGTPGHMARTHTRVRGAPEFNGERPAACLAEEILEPGPGQLRALVTIAGNPCLSAPGGAALDRAFASLELCAAVDFYINETTRHAHVILPPTDSLEHDNHEVLFHQFAVRNTVKYSPVVVPPGPEQRDDGWILAQLALRIREHREKSAAKRLAWRAARALVPGPRRVLDWMLRTGPRGDGFRPWRRGLRLRDLESAPSGIDLGPLVPRLRALLAARGRRIDLLPDVIRDELRRLARDRAAIPRAPDELLLIGRRDVRSNNSWFHNLPLSAKGPERCTLHMHPKDAAARGLADGARVRIRSAAGAVEATLVESEALRPGVVSLPHGFGHRGPGLRLGVASQRPGVSCNVLTDPGVIEPVVGNAVLNGVPVRVEAL